MELKGDRIPILRAKRSDLNFTQKESNSFTGLSSKHSTVHKVGKILRSINFLEHMPSGIDSQQRRKTSVSA